VDTKHVIKLLFMPFMNKKSLKIVADLYNLNHQHDLSLRYIRYLIGKRQKVLTFVHTHSIKFGHHVVLATCEVPLVLCNVRN
jgi:hypothetical protein